MRPNQGEDPRQSRERPDQQGGRQGAPPFPPGANPPPQPSPGQWQGYDQQAPPQPPAEQYPPQQQPPGQAAPPPQQPIQTPPQQQPPGQAAPPQQSQSATGTGQPAPPGTAPPSQQAPPGQAARAPAGPDRPRLQPVTIDDIVETDVVTADPDTPVVTVVATMAEEDVGSVVIVDEESPVGIVTDRDITLALEDTPDLTERPIQDFITDELVTGTVDMTVFEVVRQLDAAGVRRFPIVDEEGALEGIVTLDDILVLLEAELGNITDIIKTQSPRL